MPEKTKHPIRNAVLGVAAAGVLGFGAGRIAKAAANVENAGRTAATAFKTARGAKKLKLAKFAVKNARLSQALELAHATARYGGAALGTAAVTTAVGQETDSPEAAGLAAAATGAPSLFAVRAAENLSLSPTLKAGLKVAFKKIRKPIGRPW
jgi:hypothetical protein